MGELPWGMWNLLDQGLKPCPLHQQVVSWPLNQQGDPRVNFRNEIWAGFWKMNRTSPDRQEREEQERAFQVKVTDAASSARVHRQLVSFDSPEQPEGLPGRLIKLWAQHGEVTFYKWHFNWVFFPCTLLLQSQPRQCRTTSTQKTIWTQGPSTCEKMGNCTWSIWPWMMLGVACRSQGLLDCFPKAFLWSFAWTGKMTLHRKRRLIISSSHTPGREIFGTLPNPSSALSWASSLTMLTTLIPLSAFLSRLLKSCSLLLKPDRNSQSPVRGWGLYRSSLRPMEVWCFAPCVCETGGCSDYDSERFVGCVDSVRFWDLVGLGAPPIKQHLSLEFSNMKW